MKKYILFLLLYNVSTNVAQNITWTSISSKYNMPKGIQLFSGEDSSIPLKLKYIDVDLNRTDLEVSPVLSTLKTSARNWASNIGAIVVMNGGYFGGNSSYSAVINQTIEAKNIASVKRNELSYPLTRGFFGFNQDGTMAVNWIYHFGDSKNEVYYFDNPVTNADGIPAIKPTKFEGTQWENLKKGMGAGPVLIKNGKIVNTYNEEVFWGAGVSNTTVNPRSAIGYTKKNHLILLVADGRQAGVSIGASLPQMASILEKLGCYEALNCDGGGSTQLATPICFINTPSESYRSIPSVWAIFKKPNLETPIAIVPLENNTNRSNSVSISWKMQTKRNCNYRLQIATSKENWNHYSGFTAEDSSNKTLVVNQETSTEIYTCSNLEERTTYYWTVMAYKKGKLKSYYSEPISFTVLNHR